MADEKLSLNVMLLKEAYDFSEPRSFVQDFNKARLVDLADIENALLYVKKGQRKWPDWVKKVKKIISYPDLEKKIPSSQSSGVNLFVKVQERIFSINYGMLARHNVKKEAIDETFGIYTAAKIFYGEGNSTLKSAQSRVIESNPVNKQRQYGEGILPDQVLLGMEDNEALRELTILSNETDYTRLIGKYNSLTVQFKLDSKDIPYLSVLPDMLESLLDTYKDVSEDEIRKLFKGLYPIRDPHKVESLFQELESQIVADTEKFFLFEPELDFDFSSVDGFKYLVGDETHSNSDLLLKEYLEHRPSPVRDNWEEDKLQVEDEEGKCLKEWRMLDCLYGEMEFEDINYIISHGEWYSIAKDKYERVIEKTDAVLTDNSLVSQAVKDRAKDSIDQFKIDNPERKTAPKERLFNTELCEELGGELFDEIIKQVTVYEDRFEVCDIYLPDSKEFIHTKYNSGVSALSHMFNQGFVSASSHAKFGREFTSKINGHIDDPERHVPEVVEGCCVHYLILNPKTENRLTFFSKMVLEDKISQLEAMQYKVKLTWANDVY